MVLISGAGAMMCTGQQKSEQELQAPLHPTPGLPPIGGHQPGDPDGIPPDMAARQERTRNSDRQKQLVKDTDRLLALATDLKAEVDKTNKDVMSVDVIKKADEIEKLAKSVKERMKG
jgi:hypothetical protein